MAVLHVFVIPANVGIHFWAQATWIPAFAGMTNECPNPCFRMTLQAAEPVPVSRKHTGAQMFVTQRVVDSAAVVVARLVGLAASSPK